MPMPGLIKRLSVKPYLWKPPSSTNTTSVSDYEGKHQKSKSEPVSSLPRFHDPQRVGSLGQTTPSAPRTPNGHTALPPTRNLREAVDEHSTDSNPRPPDDKVNSRKLAGSCAEAVANGDPQPSGADEVLKKMEGEVLAAQGIQTSSATAMTVIKMTLDATGGPQAIEQGVNSFVEGSTVLMNALDEVAKLHPFVGVAVMAFKAVWTLEMKRRENDKKILALHLEMKDMMAVLVQLKDVKDPEEIAPDGSTIKGRMEELAHDTANDMKACANACDTYSKKKLIIKVLNGPIWEGRLAKFGGLFTKHRSSFEFALSIHTAVGVDAANRKLGDVKETTAAIDAKVDMMLKIFQNLLSPEERELTKRVEKGGGRKAVQENDSLLKELSGTALSSGSSTTASSQVGRKTGSKPYSFADLQDDLHTDPDAAIEKNMAVFSRKFEVQQKRLLDEMTAVVQRQGDRVIEAFTSGPHDRLVDPDIHKLWKEMGWRGSVKSRHFVMALHDYFHEKWGSNIQEPEAGNSPRAPISRSPSADEWALAYFNVQRLLPVSESFDDDATGFITINECNAFTSSRPLKWSLPHWIAFWAIGWHQSLAHYSMKVGEQFAKMFAILPHIHPANQSPVNKYLTEVYQDVMTIQAAVNPCYINEGLQAKFQEYLDAEEDRLKSNLETVRYDIDAMDTLTLITGPG